MLAVPAKASTVVIIRKRVLTSEIVACTCQSTLVKVPIREDFLRQYPLLDVRLLLRRGHTFSPPDLAQRTRHCCSLSADFPVVRVSRVTCRNFDQNVADESITRRENLPSTPDLTAAFARIPVVPRAYDSSQISMLLAISAKSDSTCSALAHIPLEVNVDALSDSGSHLIGAPMSSEELFVIHVCMQ